LARRPFKVVAIALDQQDGPHRVGAVGQMGGTYRPGSQQREGLGYEERKLRSVRSRTAGVIKNASHTGATPGGWCYAAAPMVR
jgi:hypothetical protein